LPTLDGAKIRDLRLRRGWSLEALAVRSGVAERTIRDLESGATASPRPNTVLWIAKALEVDPQHLWRESATTTVVLDERTAYASVIVRDLEGQVMYEKTMYSRWIMIGRDVERNDVPLPHHQVSLVHARVDVLDDGLDVRDCGTANGTFVDGERVEGSRRIEFGTPIAIVPYSIQIHRPGGSSGSPPAATLRVRRG
jgi:transcriptional regulator with XRE-family HTH domain